MYKILAFYGILKPPKCGNCTIPDAPTTPLISTSRLNEIYNSKKTNKEAIVAEIKNKLKIIIAEESCDFSDFTDGFWPDKYAKLFQSSNNAKSVAQDFFRQKTK